MYICFGYWIIISFSPVKSNSMGRKDFQKHNEEFVCKKCGMQNQKATQSERNHCRACLYYLHVDSEVPGDRASRCFGLMEPTSIDLNGKKGFMILHRCERCHKEIWNRAAPDDELPTALTGGKAYT